jgi:hypothetical protein
MHSYLALSYVHAMWGPPNWTHHCHRLASLLAKITDSGAKCDQCGEPAISLHSHHVSLVQWTTRLLPVTRDPGSNPQGGYLCETGIPLLALSRYIGDPDVIDNFCGLVWGGLCLEPSLGPRADNVIIPLDLTQLFYPGFTLAAGLPSSFTTDIVGCWGGALSRACNLTAFTPCLTGPVDYPFTSCHKGPGFKSPGGYLCETGILLLALFHHTSLLSNTYSSAKGCPTKVIHILYFKYVR